MKKIKVLGIAPYEGMNTLMMQAGRERNDMDLTVFTGDMETGAQIALKYDQNDFDFIVSRGGTAQLIREKSKIPVIEISISLYDLLRCLKLAQDSSAHYALIGFPNITKNIHLLNTLLDYQIDIFTIHSSQEAENKLIEIASSSYDVILSDTITNSFAITFHSRSILITSGIESIRSTFEQVISFGRMYHQYLHQGKIYRSLLETHPFNIYVFSLTGEILYHSRDSLPPDGLITIMQRLIPTIVKNKCKKVYKRSSGTLVSISGTLKEIDGEQLIQFHLNFRKLPLSLLKNGLLYLDKEDLMENKENFYINAPRQFIDSLVKEALDTPSPVIILAERGMDTQHFAEMLYLSGTRHNNPLTILDCIRLYHSKNWDYLMQDINSPLSDTGTTIYLRHIDQLPEAKYLELLHTIKDTGLHRHNQIIFSMTHAASEPYPDRYGFIKNLLNCVTIEIPPLRNTREYIPHIVGLSIGDYNVSTGKEIAGFEPKALELMTTFNWPFNYAQLRRVISKLQKLTTGSFIKTTDVCSILVSEKKEYELQSSSPLQPDSTGNLNLNNTLDNINKKIIEIVIKEEGGNQSAAARRLGISRTTLWRILRQ